MRACVCGLSPCSRQRVAPSSSSYSSLGEATWVKHLSTDVILEPAQTRAPSRCLRERKGEHSNHSGVQPPLCLVASILNCVFSSLGVFWTTFASAFKYFTLALITITPAFYAFCRWVYLFLLLLSCFVFRYSSPLLLCL